MPAETFAFQKPEDSPGLLLWQLTNLWQRELKKALEAHGLTHAQFVLLAGTHWLGQQPAPVTQVALAQHLRMDPMTTSTVLRTLQTKGLVQRQEHATDTRAKAVSLTASGGRLVQKAVRTVEAFDQRFFARLGPAAAAFNAQMRTLLAG